MKGAYPPRLRQHAGLPAVAPAVAAAVTGAPPLEGPDVSYAQPGVDWALVRDHRAFAVARASYGLAWADDQLARNRPAMAAQGFALWGTYHFAKANPPTSEARFFLSLTPNLGPGEARWLDAETYGNWGPDAGWCVAFADEIRRLDPGSPLALYASWSYWEAELGADDRLLERFDWLHIAAYGRLSPFGQVPKCRMWQFTDGSTPMAHETPGIGPCDSSYFDGTIDALRALATRTGTRPGTRPDRRRSLVALLDS